MVDDGLVLLSPFIVCCLVLWLPSSWWLESAGSVRCRCAGDEEVAKAEAEKWYLVVVGTLQWRTFGSLTFLHIFALLLTCSQPTVANQGQFATHTGK